MYGADVANQNRRPVVVRADDDLLYVVDRLDVSPSPHHVLRAVELDEPSADFVVRAPDRFHDLVKREAIGEQRRRLDLDLVLLDEAADRGDFGHAGNGFQPVAKIPILEGAEIR